ncbi:MAG: hypothetical protein QXV06_06935 [Ignisphaera sp.]
MRIDNDIAVEGVYLLSTILSRYIPIGEVLLKGYRNITQANLTLLEPHEINISVRGEYYYYQENMLSQIMNYLPYIIMIVGFLILAVIYLIGPRRYFVAPVKIIFGEKDLFGYIPKVNYVYEGIKFILRKYFIKVRDRAQCISCTPRELLKRVPFISKFVNTYEEVVYGDKRRSDVEEALNEVDRICGEG